MMNRETLVGYLNGLEKKYPVGSWKYKGVDVWPVLKIKLFFLYLNKYLENEKGDTSQRLSTSGIIVKFIKSWWYDWSLKFKRNQSIDIFFSDGKGHYSKLGAEYVNRFYYPIEQYFQKNTHKNIEIFRASIDEAYPDDYHKKNQTLFIGAIAYHKQIINQIIKRIKPSKSRLNFEAGEQIYEEIRSKMPDLFLSNEHLDSTIANSITEIILYKNIYKRLFKSKPAMVFELCYYTPHHYGLNLACRELNIPTYEIMHGGMGNLHIAYSGWEDSIPQVGYNVLPQHIWVWDQSSYQLIQRWMRKQIFHSCFIGGFPWLDYMIENGQYLSPLVARQKKIIIYTLQFEFIEEYIYEAMRLTEADYEWWLRLHPRKGYAKDNIYTELEKRGLLHKVNMEEANHIPLPIILKNCWIHLSEFSGSIIEACLLGKKTIILSEVGAQAYYQYVQNGLCILSTDRNPTSLTRHIIQNQEPVVFHSEALKKVAYSIIFEDII